jgi:protocatechuate 3,4-dioxygenase beta subunit
MPITRRQALSGLVLAAAAKPVAALAATPERTAAILPTANACVLTAQAEEGPFYLDPHLERADIAEGRPGVPLRLLLQIIDAATCAPLAGARVDIWHADAGGLYSGFGAPGQPVSTATRFLRGTQFADSAGEVRFSTIYPGWYHGRTAHIHAKIILDETCVLNAQLYFPDALSEFIYGKAAPYRRKELRDTANATDGVLHASGGGHESFCNIKEEADHYLASLVIAADRDGKPVAGPAGGPPPGMGRPGGPPPDFAGGRPPGPPPLGQVQPRPADWDRTLIPGLAKRSD